MNKQLLHQLTLLFSFILLLNFSSFAQKKKKNNTAESIQTEYPEELYNSMTWRCIGPFRGGRSAAVTGVPNQPNLYYFGAAGGGVWKSIDAGGSWTNISDGFFGGSIGAVAVAPSDPNVIYVGGGEKTVRGNVSHGDGMWKSVDAGKTWEFMGLPESRHITRIRIHPDNPDVVYAAVLGHLFASNEERGVYRSKDGGKSWEKILFANENAGAVDLIFDPNNTRVLYASTWNIRRTPYSLESGGEGSALWKSTDGGDTWTELTKEKKGLPKGDLGIIGVTVSPANSNRVWAIIEAEEGGVYRSDDTGETWTRINEERKLRQRAWYYTRIYADPQNTDVVYVLNVRFHKSKDGGRTFEAIKTPHGDHHDLWIAPDNPNQMIVGDDGGAQVSQDGGTSWSTYQNQPTSQFYRITTDNHFPYRIYGAQQDNSSVRILSRSDESVISERHWEATAGGESAHLAPHPTNPEIVYGGSYGGFLTRVNHETNEVRVVDVYPDNPMGWAAKDLKYRFQWNFPILFSPHDESTLYAAANVLFKTTNEGQSWEEISPDLTRDDKSKMESSGGLITQDNTSVEYYGTIFAVAESIHETGVIWTGSDDGLVYLTKDGGQNWENVTPKDMPEWMMINSIEIDPFNAGGAYLAGTRYKLDDFQPYLYKTTDYGQTWQKITKGIADDHFTRVLRADPERQGLLYAGTERGVYASFDDGENWQPLQLNLPIVPITDLTIKEKDLIVATQGRSFWVLDDLTVLHQLSPDLKNKSFHLFQPRASYNTLRDKPAKKSKLYGQNPPNGVAINFYFASKPDTNTMASLEILDAGGNSIRTFNYPFDKKKDKKENELKLKKGANQFTWDLRYDKAVEFEGMILWFGGTQGPRAIPGNYQVKLTLNGEEQIQPFEILIDPRSEASQADMEAQFDFLMSIRDKLDETHQCIKKIRSIKADIQAFLDRLPQEDETYQSIKEEGKAIQDKLTTVEEALYQTKNRSRQDPLNYPIRLNNKLSILATLCGFGNYRPTDQMYQVRDEITQYIDAELSQFYTIISEDVPNFNSVVAGQSIPAIAIPED